MRTRPKRTLALIIVMLSCCMVLVSCEAITAQKISSTDSGTRGSGGQGFTGGRGKNGGRFPDMGGGMRRNGGQGAEDGGTSGEGSRR